MKIRDGIFSKKIKDLLVYGFGQAINLLSPLIVMPYLISICGEDGFGKIGVGFSLALILCGIVDYGSYIKGVKEISIHRNDDDFVREKLKAIYFSKLIVLLLVAAITAMLILCVPFFSREKTLLFLSLAIVVGQFINPAWYFQATENFKWISGINILSKIIYVTCVFLCIDQKGDYIYANLFFGIGAITANLVGFLYVFKRYDLSKRFFSTRPAFAILREEFSFTASQFFLSVYQFFPIMIVSYIGGDFLAGQFRVIDQMITIFKSALNIFFYFVYANVCFELNKSLKQGLVVWRRYNGLFFLFLLLLAGTCFINAELIFTYFKINPSQIGMVSHFFRIALAVPMLIAISLPLRQLMFALDKNNLYITITIMATIVNVILLALLTGIYGLAGAFISIIIIELIVIVLYVLILKKTLRHPQNGIL